MEAQKAQGFFALAILLFITPVVVSSFIFCTVFWGSDTYLRMGKMLPILEFQLLINICKECTCQVYYVCPSVLLCIRKSEPKNLFIRQVFTLFRGHEGPQGEQRYRSTLYRTSALDVMWGQPHAPAVCTPPPPERKGTHFTGGWVGPRAGLDGRKISYPPGLDPGPSSSQSVAIPTELPGPLLFY